MVSRYGVNHCHDFIISLCINRCQYIYTFFLKIKKIINVLTNTRLLFTDTKYSVYYFFNNSIISSFFKSGVVLILYLSHNTKSSFTVNICIFSKGNNNPKVV